MQKIGYSEVIQVKFQGTNYGFHKGDTFRKSYRNIAKKRSLAKRKSCILRRQTVRDIIMHSKKQKIRKMVIRPYHFNQKCIFGSFKRRCKLARCRNDLVNATCSKRVCSIYPSKKSKSSLRSSSWNLKKLNQRKIASFWTKLRSVDGYKLRKRVPSALTCSKHGVLKNSEYWFNFFLGGGGYFYVFSL